MQIMCCEPAAVGAKQWKKLSLTEKDAWNKQSLESSESYAEKMWSVCKKVVFLSYNSYCS